MAKGGPAKTDFSWPLINIRESSDCNVLAFIASSDSNVVTCWLQVRRQNVLRRPVTMEESAHNNGTRTLVTAR